MEIDGRDIGLSKDTTPTFDWLGTGRRTAAREEICPDRKVARILLTRPVTTLLFFHTTKILQASIETVKEFRYLHKRKR